MTHDLVAATPSDEDDVGGLWRAVIGRRSFLKGMGAVGAATLPAGALVSAARAAGPATTKGDIAILRFLAAAELIESDLWQQYAELGGAGGGNPSYMAALSNLDADMPQYISDNTDDELSHAAFLNAYIMSKGGEPVSLKKFEEPLGSKATGARKVGRLTNLRALDVDTGYYFRYRSGRNPDLGATFAQALDIKAQPAIPLDDTDTPPDTAQPVPPTSRNAIRMQAIANTAAFHFAMIEQGGSSLYSTLSLKASSLEVLRILVSIGGVETNHFSLWHDKLGNAVSQPLAGVTDPVTHLSFPDFNSPPFGGELRQTNLILPEPTQFLSSSFPVCSVVRPTLDRNAGARAAIQGLTADRLFDGQSQAFLRFVTRLADEADAAVRTTR